MSGPEDRAAWHAARLQSVGGSEVAALFLSPDQMPAYALSRFALWQIKAGNAPAPEVDNERVRWGLRLEDAIAHGVAEDNGWTVEKGGHVVSPITPGMACTLDYIVHKPDRPDPGALEIKNVDWLAHRRTWVDDEPPLHIGLQLQHQLACTGYQWGVVGGLIGGNTAAIYPYEAKPKLIAEIRRKVTEFWQSIADNRPPPVDGSDAAAAVIQAMFPEVVDEVADLEHVNDGPELCATYLKSAAAKKLATADYDLARNALMLAMCGHKAARFTGFTVRMAVSEAKPPREALAGEMIPGRAESRRISSVKEQA